MSSLEDIHTDVVEIINEAKGLKPDAMKRYLIEQMDNYFKEISDVKGPNEVGQRIKNIRLNLGLNQEEFAKKIDSTIPAVSNWENGRNLPNKQRLKAIADIGGITVDELLNGAPNHLRR